MSHYARDLTTPCACANLRDGEWFIANPSRSKYIREPWECERTPLLPEHEGHVSQIVAVWTDRSVDAAVEMQAEGIVQVRVYRRSFLFVGEADWTRIDSDTGVDRFMLFIDDSNIEIGHVTRPN